MAQITIIGTGLIGGSIGLALMRAKAPDQVVVAHDKEPSVANRALKRGAADRREFNLLAAVRDADLVIVATPALAIKETLELIGPHLKPGTVVTDTGSTKSDVLQWGKEFLPKEVSFVGGHPMAGKETSGIEAADPDLFRGATYCILPTTTATPEAVDTVINLAKLLEARPYFIDVAEHDSYVAAVSHLPLVLSSALVNCAAKSPAWREIGKVAAGGFHDVSRLASGDPVMSRDICLTNPQLILHWIDVFSRELAEFRRLISQGSAELEQAFSQATEYRDRWIADRLEEMAETIEIPRTREALASVFMGQTLASRMMGSDDEERDNKSRGRDKG